ncbi:MAG: hypothetical protein H0Z32_05245 [Bacillaceae bacterium]|nr:hypothetical protein [Bacillaceae bacterium]
MSFKSYNETLSNVGQNKGAWASDNTSCGGTMAAEGCFVTAFANLVNAHGNSDDPGDVLNALKPNRWDCPFAWAQAGTLYSLSNNLMYGDFDTVKGYIFDEIVNNNRPVIIDVGGKHTVTTDGFSGTLTVFPEPDGTVYPDTSQITTDMIHISDPGSNYRFTLDETIAHTAARM